MKSENDQLPEHGSDAENSAAVQQLQGALDRVNAELNAAAAERKRLEKEIEQLAAELSARRRNQAREIQKVLLGEKALRDELSRAFQSSASWRITAPLRSISDKLRDISSPRSASRSTLMARRVQGSDVEASHSPPTSPSTIDQKGAARVWLKTRLTAFLSSSGHLRFDHGATPEVSIVLVLYNSAELTYACLSSVAEASHSSGLRPEVIILDNGSTDATSALLNRIDGAKIIRSADNLHFLRGANLAAREATGKYLLFLNNDAMLLPGSLEAALSSCDEDEAIGAIGGRIILPDGNLQEAGSIVWRDGSCAGYGRSYSPDAPECMFQRDVDYCSGAFLLTPRHLFESLHGFDERYAPAYYEETDYCLRIWQSGRRVVFHPDIVLVHFEFGSAAAPSEALELQRRNQAVFRERHSGWLRTQWSNSPANLLCARTARIGSQRRILFIEDRIPHPRLGAGYPRSHELLRALADAGAQVTLFPMFKRDESWADIRDSIPSSVEVMKDMAAEDLEGHLRERDGYYDALLVCRPHNMRALLEIGATPSAANGEPATVIYDAEALFAARDLMRMRLAGKAPSAAQAQRMLAEEVALTRSARVITSVSEEEKRQFEEYGAASVLVLGYPIEVTPTPTSFHERSGFLFVGAIHDDDSPNAESLRWFVSEVWPLIQSLAGGRARLDIVGFNRAASIMALESPTISLVGEVDELGPWYERARVVVVPTRIAAGIPLKAQTAAAFGVPMVATELIAKQLGWTSDVDLLAANDPPGFAQACIRLHSEPGTWERLRTSALERVAIDCSHDRFRATVDELLMHVPEHPRVGPD